MYLRNCASLLLAAIVAFSSTACTSAMYAAKAQHDLTTPSMLGIAAADSTATALGFKSSKTPAEQEFLLKMEQIKANRDVGVATAKAKAAALAILLQRGGYGQYTGYLGRCGPAGC